MPTEIEGLREGQLERLRVTTKIRPGQHTVTPEQLAAREAPLGGCNCASGLSGCGCRFAGLEDLAQAAGEQPVVELTVQFMDNQVTPAAVRSEVQRLATLCGCRLASKRKAQIEQYVLWTWKAIGGDRWRAYIANTGPFKGTPGPVVSLGRSGQPPTVHQTNLLPGQIQRFVFRLIPEDGQDKQENVKANLSAMQIMLERSGAAQIALQARTLSMPAEQVEALEGLEGINPLSAVVGMGLLGAGWLAYRLYMQGAGR